MNRGRKPATSSVCSSQLPSLLSPPRAFVNPGGELLHALLRAQAFSSDAAPPRACNQEARGASAASRRSHRGAQPNQLARCRVRGVSAGGAPRKRGAEFGARLRRGVQLLGAAAQPAARLRPADVGEQARQQRRAAARRCLALPRSPQFALRSYLYLLLHALFAAPASLALGADGGKRLVFHALRAVLGAACAAAEAALCRAVAGAGGRRLGLLLWATLLVSSGMFTSSTTLLPSTFTMVAFTAGAALSLSRQPKVRGSVSARLSAAPGAERRRNADGCCGVRCRRPAGLAVCGPRCGAAWSARAVGRRAASDARGGCADRRRGSASISGV